MIYTYIMLPRTKVISIFQLVLLHPNNNLLIELYQSLLYYLFSDDEPVVQGFSDDEPLVIT